MRLCSAPQSGFGQCHPPERRSPAPGCARETLAGRATRPGSGARGFWTSPSRPRGPSRAANGASPACTPATRDAGHSPPTARSAGSPSSAGTQRGTFGHQSGFMVPGANVRQVSLLRPKKWSLNFRPDDVIEVSRRRRPQFWRMLVLLQVGFQLDSPRKQ